MSAPPVIALYNHNGLLGSNILKSLVRYHTAGTIKLVVLHRPSSDLSSIPAGVETRAVVVDDPSATDEAANKTAVKGLNVVVSAASIPGTAGQVPLIKALAGSLDLWAWIPSKYGPNWLKEETSDPRLALLTARDGLDYMAMQLGLPVTAIKAASFVEWAFNDDHVTTYTNVRKNLIKALPGWDTSNIPLVSVPYLGEAVAQLVATRPKSLAGKTFDIFEYNPTGQDIANAFEKINGVAPKVDMITPGEYESMLDQGMMMAVLAGLAKKWADNNWKWDGEAFKPEGWKSPSLEEIIRGQK